MIKKICLFSTSFAFNRQVVVDYIEKIFPQDVEIFIFVPKKYQSSYTVKRAKIVETNCTKYTSFFALRKFCLKNNIDRIINLGCLPQEGFAMAFASIFTNTDFICHYLGNPIASLKFRFDKWGIKGFFETLFLIPMSFFPKRILIPSKDILEFCRRYLFLAREKISWLPVTINTSLFSPLNKEKIRKKLNLSSKKIVIFVGRIEYLKGADILYELAERNKDILFLLVGKLDYFEKNLLELPNIKILSALSSKELAEYYNASDLNIQPSRLESYGIVPREAMACGTPSIVSDIIGLKMIQHSIKTPIDADKIEQEMKNFFNLSKKEKETLSKASREFVVNESSDIKAKDLYIKEILN
ncbi:glycosyltransferase family 4 protein [Candidatus Pacearchaeota archaeon]|nr:glycosyltransferase family 4 protein [Candidatus Pacearchaeota archaeon]